MANYKKFNCCLLIISIIILLISICSSFIYGSELKKINKQYNETIYEYNQEVEKQKQLKSYTAEDIKSEAERKARREGYCYPSEKLFYNID